MCYKMGNPGPCSCTPNPIYFGISGCNGNAYGAGIAVTQGGVSVGSITLSSTVNSVAITAPGTYDYTITLAGCATRTGSITVPNCTSSNSVSITDFFNIAGSPASINFSCHFSVGYCLGTWTGTLAATANPCVWVGPVTIDCGYATFVTTVTFTILGYNSFSFTDTFGGLICIGYGGYPTPLTGTNSPLNAVADASYLAANCSADSITVTS